MAEGNNRRARRTLTRELIFTQALAIVDEAGLDALSLRALGTRLGVSQTAFYRHAPDKAALLEGITEMIWREALAHLTRAAAPASEAASDAVGDWSAPFERYAWELRRTLGAHPRAIMLMLTHPIATPGQFGVVAEAAAQLSEAGCEIGPYTLDLITALSVYTMGFAAAEHSAPAGGAAAEPGLDAARKAMQVARPAARAALAQLLAPREAPAARVPEGEDDLEVHRSHFAPGLRALLRGWEKPIPAGSGGPQP